MVVGLGYVGLVVAAGLAHTGHRVIGVDIDQVKIRGLQNDSKDITEPGLSEIIAAERNNTLRFQHVSEIAAITDQIVFICVGTPTKTDSTVDLSQVITTINWIKEKAQTPVTIVMKSTVPPGTGKNIIQKLLIDSPEKYYYVMNPEFLREGQALDDWFHPDRTVIGSERESALKIMYDLYRNLETPIVSTDITSAEMIKYASNAFLATKISFINKVAQLCEGVGADVEVVSRGIGLDRRIGPSFLHAGIGYGGSCFPKDVKALETIFNKKEIHYGLLRAVIDINNKQRQLAVSKLKATLGNLDGKKVAVLGLAFKPDTDDVREAPAVDIVKLLCKGGAEVHAYDPLAMSNAKKQLSTEVKYYLSAMDALQDTQGAIIVTEWNEFIKLDWVKARAAMKAPYALIDGRNCLSPELMKKYGFKYYGFGRSNSRVNPILTLLLSVISSGVIAVTLNYQSLELLDIL